MAGIPIILGFADSEKVYWYPLETINPHGMIVGTTGAGKTQLLKTIAAELSRHGVPVVVFDVHGEYRDLVEDLGGRLIDYKREVRINPLDPGKRKPKAVAFEVREIISNIFRGLGDIQRNMLYELIIEAYKEKGFDPDKEPTGHQEPPDFNDLARIIENKRKERQKDQALEGLIARLKPLLDFNLFSAERGLNISELLKPGITVIDLSTLDVPSSEELKSAIVVFTSRKLWDHLYLLGPIKGRQLRVALILDEAHRYLFENSPIYYMLREGRKYGVSVLLASQMVKDIPDVAIANTSLKVALKLDNPRDRKKILDIFVNAKLKDLPSKRFEALVYIDGLIRRIKIIPYYKYQELLKIEGEQNKKPGPIKPIGEGEAKTSDEEKAETLDELITIAVKNRNIPLIDALYQWSQNPIDSSAGYGVEENYKYILENLAIRYDDDKENDKETARKVVKTLREHVSTLLEKERDINKLKGEIMRSLSESGGLELLKQEVVKRVAKLSPNEKLALYMVLEALWERGEDRAIYLADVKSILNELGVYLDQMELERIAIWSGATSKLLWISPKDPTQSDVVYVKPVFIGEIYGELEKSDRVIAIRKEFEEAIRKAIESWYIDALMVLYKLETQEYFSTDTSMVLEGPEKYTKILARHIRHRQKDKSVYEYYIIPKRFREAIKSALTPLKDHISKVEELVDNYITNYIKYRQPSAERGRAPRPNCARINLLVASQPDPIKFIVCIWPILEKATLMKMKPRWNNIIIHVAVLAPLDLIMHNLPDWTGVIVAKPSGVLYSHSTLFNSYAQAFLLDLTKHLKNNI